MENDQKASDELRQYKIFQIVCLLWVNLFPYLFGFAWYLVAPGYVILKRLDYLGHVFILLGLLQIVVMLGLMSGRIMQKSLFNPRNLQQWFLASIFIIFLSVVIVVPPSLIIYTNPCAQQGPDELDKASFGPFVTKDTPIAPAVVAQENERIGRVRNVRIFCLMILLINVLLCGIWFTRTNKMIQALEKNSSINNLMNIDRVLITLLGLVVLLVIPFVAGYPGYFLYRLVVKIFPAITVPPNLDVVLFWISLVVLEALVVLIIAKLLYWSKTRLT